MRALGGSAIVASVSQLHGIDRAAATKRELLVMPHERRDGFWANIRGHVLDLADPRASNDVAPTPDDLYVASVASELAWAAHELLRARGLPDDVSVSAEWLTDAHPPRPTALALTITVPRRAEAIRAELADALGSTLAARSLVETTLHISTEGAIR